MMAFDKEGSGAKMELVEEIKRELWRVLVGKDVTFYAQSKLPLWSGSIDQTWSYDEMKKEIYVSAFNVQTWNKDGSPRKGSAKFKGKTQIFPGYYYSFGLTPEGVTPQPEADEAVLTQAQVDAKLKEYVTRRIEELTYFGPRQQENINLNRSFQQDWHVAEAFVTIFKELTE